MSTTRNLEIKLAKLLAQHDGPAPVGSALRIKTDAVRAELAANRAAGGTSLQTRINNLINRA